MATMRAFRGHFTPEHHHGVEIPGIYWHFVDVMWIVVYSTVYLLWRRRCANPFRSEAEAYRFLLLTVAYFALIVVGGGDRHAGSGWPSSSLLTAIARRGWWVRGRARAEPPLTASVPRVGAEDERRDPRDRERDGRRRPSCARSSREQARA